MNNNNFEIMNHSHSQKVLIRSKADGISLFIYDKRQDDDKAISFIYQRHTQVEAMDDYRLRLYKVDSFLQKTIEPGAVQGTAVGLKTKENNFPSTPSSADASGIYWRGLGAYGYRQTACMIHPLSKNLHLIIGMQMLQERKNLCVEQALSAMEDWISDSSDYILENSINILRSKCITESPLHHLEDIAQGISPREQQVVFEIVQGKSNKQIAKTLSLSNFTIENHLRRIYQKFGVKSRTELIAAVNNGGSKLFLHS
jgi:DNA-binding CsgD family transcriptional regulator